MPTTPPLWVCIVGTLLTVSMVGWSEAPRYRAHFDQSPGDPMALYTRQFLTSPRSSGDTRVVALGSSLLWAATPAAESAAAAGQQHLRWMRLSRGGSGLGYLNSSLDEVERDPPQILLIEGNVLLPLQTSKLNDKLRNDVMLGLKRIALSLRSWSTATPAAAMELPNDQLHDFSCDLHAASGVTAGPLQHSEALRQLYRDARPDQELVAQLNRLARRGVHVVILDLPRSAPVEQAVANEKRQWLARVRTALPPRPALDYHTAPTHPVGPLYCDGSHLSLAGSRMFGHWWWQELREIRKARG